MNTEPQTEPTIVGGIDYTAVNSALATREAYHKNPAHPRLVAMQQAEDALTPEQFHAYDRIVSMASQSDREAARNALVGVISNGSNYPARVMPYILGLDMGPLLDKVVDAVLAAGFTRKVSK